ncbi:ABC transporter ATP-binding protein [Levilactobacillus fuyuanensis]|uniref:ATP-binding cassette domain-containing protein n=1 Tax=Levilactobacillus fuyuanensis TaxID=2486022 RepID=A0ABW4H6S9_9LACO|nr:ABC transporter ATP-binding protein [Levilactobacillus fuyuanensis]
MLLEAKHLTKTFGSHVAVNGLNLQIGRGSFTALLGPNGAGKSTTMNLLIGLTTPSLGQVSYADQVKRGVVFQNSVLDERLTVTENLQIRAKQYRHVAKTKVAAVSAELGLTAFAHQQYGTLSGGQKRRVDIARALLNDPDILFLDEPTTGLDIQTRTAIWDLLRHLQRTRELTVVLTTHYLDEADAADSVYIIDHGSLVAAGTATAIKTRYAEDVLQVTSSDVDRLRARLTVAPTECDGNRLIFKLSSPQDALEVLTTNRELITTFEFRPGTMDDAFLALTGREMR